MEEFLNKLYSYEYFGLYLIISIIVLVILFVIILFFGKKDQKVREIEATKKLQQINNDAFKEESIGEKLEIARDEQEKLENDTIIIPSIEDIPNVAETTESEIPEPVLPVQEGVKVEDVVIDTPVIEPVVDEEVQEITPLLDKIEEKPLIFNELNFETEEIKHEEPKEEKIEIPEIKSEKEEMEVPAFNFDEIVKDVEDSKKEQNYTKGPDIFSSVYVPEKKEVETPKVEVKKEANNDLEFELPMLKKDIKQEEKIEEVKEDKIEMPVLNDYDLDNIAGETYTINK